MFNRMVNKIAKRIVEGEPFDPATLNDPVAMKAEWSPIEHSGSSFCTHELISLGPDRIEFRPTIGLKLFLWSFLLTGFGVVTYFAFQNYPFGHNELGLESYLPLIVGIIFVGAGAYYLRTTTLPIVFDKNKHYFWKGKNPPGNISENASTKIWCDLNDVYALQIISEFCSGSKSSYFSYELNIVLKDGHRINIVDHGNKARIDMDARTLSVFLKVPLWSAI